MADITKRIRDAVRVVRGQANARPIKESGSLLAGPDPDLNLAAGAGGSRYFRPLTSSPKDIRPYDHQRMLEIAVYLYQSNPLAKRIIERRTNFILGEGLRVVAQNSSVQGVIDKFWNDPYNKMARNLHGYVNAWRAYGELVLMARVNDKDGLVRLGFISPDRITAVEPNPVNIQDIRRVYIELENRASLGTYLSETQGTPFEVIRFDDDPSSDTYEKRTGQVFYFTANTLPDMVRGMSDLWAIADYCDGYETTIWDLVERAGIVNAFVIHVQKEGASQEELEEWWLKHGSDVPRAGEIIATNEKEDWKFLTPSFAGQDVAAWSDLILSMIATGADMPKFWLNAQMDPNRAAAEQMAGPVVKGLIEMQREMVAWIEDIIEFVIDQAILHKELDEGVDRTFQVEVPEISGRDLAGTGQVFLQAVQGLVAARAEKLVDEHTARRTLLQLVNRLGVERTIEEVEEALEKEIKKEEEEAARAPQEMLPFPGGPTPGGQGVPGAENTGNAAKAGAPRRTPTPRAAKSDADGSMAGGSLTAAVERDVVLNSVFDQSRRIFEGFERLDADSSPEEVMRFVEHVRGLPDGMALMSEIIRQSGDYVEWMPESIVDAIREHASHDQKSHGRRGGGGGGEMAERAAKTLWPQIASDVAAGNETGFTYHPGTGSQPSSGWSVATEHGTGMLIENAAKNMGPDQIRQFAAQRASEFMDDPDKHLGGWLNPADGSFHLDVAVVKQDKAAAVAAGVDKSQVGIFNLGTFDTYNLTRSDYQKHGGKNWREKWNSRPTDSVEEAIRRAVHENWPGISRLREHASHNQKDHNPHKGRGGGGGGDGLPTLKPGGRLPKGRKQFVDGDKDLALIKVRGGTYALVSQQENGKFRVEGRGLTREEALAHAKAMKGGGEAKPAQKGAEGGSPSDALKGEIDSSGIKSTDEFSTGPNKASINNIYTVTLENGQKYVGKRHNDKSPTDADLRDYIDGVKDNVVSQHPEVAAFNIAEKLGFKGLVPPTTITDVPGMGKMMLQQFVPGLKPGTGLKFSEIDSVMGASIRGSDEGRRSWAQTAVLDAIMGNMDRHAGNQFFVGKGKDARLKAVDNGLPIEYAREYTIGSNKMRVLSDAMGDPDIRRHIEKTVSSLPRIEFDDWKRMTSDGTELGDRFARGSYHRYRTTIEMGVPATPDTWLDY